MYKNYVFVENVEGGVVVCSKVLPQLFLYELRKTANVLNQDSQFTGKPEIETIRLPRTLRFPVTNKKELAI